MEMVKVGRGSYRSDGKRALMNVSRGQHKISAFTRGWADGGGNVAISRKEETRATSRN